MTPCEIAVSSPYIVGARLIGPAIGSWLIGLRPVRKGYCRSSRSLVWTNARDARLPLQEPGREVRFRSAMRERPLLPPMQRHVPLRMRQPSPPPAPRAMQPPRRTRPIIAWRRRYTAAKLSHYPVDRPTPNGPGKSSSFHLRSANWWSPRWRIVASSWFAARHRGVPCVATLFDGERTPDMQMARLSPPPGMWAMTENCQAGTVN
jgi:hypothetical protein